MSSSRVFTPLFLLSISLLLHLALAATPIYQRCSTSENGNFTANGKYNKNLNKLMKYLNSKTPLTGFGSGSVGKTKNQVYGLALCRGDLNSTGCQACVNQASIEIEQVCPFKKEAVTWYAECLLRYSNLDFFGQPDFSEAFYYPYFNNVSDAVHFNKTVMELLEKLDGEAYVSPKLYAAGNLVGKIGGNSTTIYGLVQCTRDLSSATCKTCLDWIISFVPKLLYGKEGGIIMSGSCVLEYATYPFFN